MRFTFLSYAPRSGSTKLAGLLDAAHRHVLVLPELRSPLWLIEAERSQPLSAETVRSILRRDPQATDLGFDADQIVAGLGPERPTTPTVLRAIAHTHARDLGEAAPTHVVVKHGRSAERFDDIRRVAPDAKLLHLARDPRGVANSMQRSFVPRDPAGANFARNNPLYPARLWRDRHNAYLEASRKYPDATKMITFADLGDTARIEAIASWVTEASPDQRRQPQRAGSTGGRARPIPAVEHAIHGLAAEAFQSDRDQAWRTELAPSVAHHIETLLWEEMSSLSMTDRAKPTRSEVLRANAADLVRRPREITTRMRTVAQGRFVSPKSA